MKKSKIVVGLLVLVGLWFWSVLVWTEPTQLNSDSRQNETVNSSFIYALYSETETAIEEGRKLSRNLTLQAEAIVGDEAKKDASEILIEGCEYMKMGGGRLWGYVHKGNCKNLIHPENSVDLVKLNKLLNSPMLQNILK